MMKANEFVAKARVTTMNEKNRCNADFCEIENEEINPAMLEELSNNKGEDEDIE